MCVTMATAYRQIVLCWTGHPACANQGCECHGGGRPLDRTTGKPHAGVS
jgi:hypothetical protein